ncbi:hypothetical protein N7478_013297 [Penicillium angulare]|uniref:uncharacterized protein n=1 Tax=Penicillium angulare TaxID=116970 RepID=UPI0025416694|nr:uncharacterized protein N7478_013297 [Penicillium angulare]KAJ5257193.1 hypothetical protein N7478_013297 [Penicillium angulare]
MPPMYSLSCFLGIFLATATHCVTASSFEACLRPQLSPAATLITGQSSNVAPRWTEYKEFSTNNVVNASTEADVQAAVRCANKAGVKFFAQSGGNAWATTWSLGENDVVINLRNMNQININAARTSIEVGGGAIVSEVIDAAYKKNTQVVTPNCNCVGIMGAMLGAGYSRFMGDSGFVIDNVLSFRVVLASGESVTVSPSSHPDLWWAMRGAGGNFGIVVSATFKAYPTLEAQNGAWVGNLVFSDEKIEQVVSAVNNLKLTSKMAIFFYFANIGAPNYTPIFMVTPFYLSGGNTTAAMAEARRAFASVLNLGPLEDTTTWTPYNEVNAGSDTFCVSGSRKVSYGAGLAQLDPATWRTIYTNYSNFLIDNGGDNVANSLVLMEAYSLQAAEENGDFSSAYAWRSTNRFNTVAIAWYTDDSLDEAANAWAGEVRDNWRATSGLRSNSTYINFAFGDETLEDIYGSNVPLLRGLKTLYDPKNKFGQFFPLYE